MARRREPRIVDPVQHRRDRVCLTVAADYLGLDERTVRARIEEGKLPADVRGKSYRIRLADLVAYKARLSPAGNKSATE